MNEEETQNGEPSGFSPKRVYFATCLQASHPHGFEQAEGSLQIICRHLISEAPTSWLCCYRFLSFSC